MSTGQRMHTRYFQVGGVFEDIPVGFERKVKAYTTIEGYAGALAWSWQPGNAGKCRFENLDSDKPVQEIMRTVGGDVAETVGRVVEGIRDGLGTALGTVQGTPAR